MREKNPDVLCLQELKCTDEKFPLNEIQNLGYEAAIHGQKTYNGVALISRHPIREVTYGFDGQRSENSARLIGATINSLTIYSIYVPNGQEVGSDKYKEKLHFFKLLNDYINERHRESDRFVLAGDFNVAPTEKDVHDPEVWRGKVLFSDRERRSLETLEALGMVDTYRRLFPNGKEYSWWDYRGFSFQKNEGLRIDLIFASLEQAPKLMDAGVYRDFRKLEKASDHAPIYATFTAPDKTSRSSNC